jgi:putative peptidoglycan lipid II flippase
VANLFFVVLLIGPLPSPPDSIFGQWMAGATRALALVDLRHGGLALSTSLAATVNLILLAVLLGRRAGGLTWGPWLGSMLRTLLASSTMVPVVLAITGRIGWFDPAVSVLTRVAWLVVAVSAGAAVCALALNVLGGAEVVAFRRAVLARLGRRRTPRAS